MIIIWKGAGGLVIIFGILAALTVNIVTSAVFNKDNYFADHSWSQATALAIAGAASWFLGRYVNNKPGTFVTDKVTGEEVLQKPNHHLMFIKMQYWGLVYLAIGLAVLVVGLLKS